MNAEWFRFVRFAAAWLIIVAASFWPLPADAQDEVKPDAARAVTTAIPDVPLDELELLLAPLSKHELADEAEGWHVLLKAKVVEMSAAEIAVKRKNVEIEQVGVLAELLDEALEPVEGSAGESTTGESDSAAQSPEVSRSPQNIHALAQANIRKIAELEAIGAAEGAVADAVKAANERAQSTSTARVAVSGEADPVGADLPEGGTREPATTAEALAAAGDLEELRKRTAEVAQAKESVREVLFEHLDVLRDQRNAIIERSQVVLDGWQAKGGEITDYALYIEAVDDVNVDTADTVTAWTTMLDWAGAQVEALTKRLSGAIFDIVVVVLLGLAVWIMVKTAVRRHLGADGDDAIADPSEADGEVGGVGATRVETLLPLLQSFITITIVVFVVMISLSSLGVDVAPLLAGAGMVGIAIGFGAQTLVRDVMSGFFFLLDDAFRMGEYVEIDSIRGTVERISVRSLQLRHHNGPVHTIPFGEVRHLTNYSRDYAIMKFEIRLPFETDIDKVRKIIKKTGVEMMEDEAFGPNMLAPLKSQGVNRMDDSALIVRCKFTAKPGEQFVLRREAYVRIQQALAEAGIHFAPRRVIVETASQGGTASPEATYAAAGAAADPEGGGASDRRG